MEIIFWPSTQTSTRPPVMKFLNTEPFEVRKKVQRHLEYLKLYGIQRALNTKHFKHMSNTKPKLYELKFKSNGNFYRIFITFKGTLCYLLHAIKKKTGKTPQNDLATAISRAKSLDN